MNTKYKATTEGKKYLGKISNVNFGLGDYQGLMFGLSVEFTFDECCCVGDFVSGFWGYHQIDCGECAKWTEEDRGNAMIAMCQTVSLILKDAKCDKVHELLNKPVELTFDRDGKLGSTLISWRILTEVL